VIANYRTTEAMLRYFINKALGGLRIFRSEVMVAVPGGITSTERRAVIDATIAAGARAAYIIKEPIVAAIGADVPIGSASGHMIIDIGGGTAEIAVLSLGGIVASGSVRIGGNKFDAAIGEHVRRKYNLGIGERSAEDIKIQIGSALYLDRNMSMEVKGRDVITGLPRTITVSSHDVTDAIQLELEGLVQAVKDVLHQTPPELSAVVSLLLSWVMRSELSGVAASKTIKTELTTSLTALFSVPRLPNKVSNQLRSGASLLAGEIALLIIRR